LQVRDNAVHGEHAIGGNETKPGGLGSLQLLFQVSHVVVAVAKALGFT
jgi:hypothetical protein